MRQVHKQLRRRTAASRNDESTDLRFEGPDLDSIGALIRSIDLLLSNSD